MTIMISHLRLSNNRQEKYYRAVFKDGLHQRVLRRHCKSATVAEVYGANVRHRLYKFQDASHGHS
jgi:hypothetical protein